MEINGRISVFGGRNITPEVYENSVEIGRLLAQEGFLVFCGVEKVSWKQSQKVFLKQEVRLLEF